MQKQLQAKTAISTTFYLWKLNP